MAATACVRVTPAGTRAAPWKDSLALRPRQADAQTPLPWFLELVAVHWVEAPLVPVPCADPSTDLLTDEPYHEALLDAARQRRDAHAPRLLLFGLDPVTAASRCVVVHGLRPWFRVALATDAERPEALARELERDLGLDRRTIAAAEERLPPLYGAQVDLTRVPENACPADPSPPLATVRYAKLSFPSHRILRRVLTAVRARGRAVADAKLAPEIQALRDAGINPAGLCVVRSGEIAPADAQVSHCQTEVHLPRGFADGAAAGPWEPAPAVAPPPAGRVICSFDGEMLAWDRGTFPRAERGDRSICVSAVFRRTDLRDRMVRVVLVVGPTDVPRDFFEDPDCFVGAYETPRDMWEAFRDYCVVRMDPDVLTGWNTYGFDNVFLLREYALGFAEPARRLLDLVARELQRATGAREDRPLEDLFPELCRALRGLPDARDAVLEAWDRELGPELIAGVLRGDHEALESLLHAKAVRARAVAEAALVERYGDDPALDPARRLLHASLGANPADLLPRAAADPAVLEALVRAHGAAVQRILEAPAPALAPALLAPCELDAAFRMGARVPDRALRGGVAALRDPSEALAALVARAGSRFDGEPETADPAARVVARGLFLSRLRADPCALRSRVMASAAKGDNVYYMWGSAATRYRGLVGRAQMDAMQVFKDAYRLSQNSLDYAARTFLKDAEHLKVDLPHETLRSIALVGDPSQMARIVHYCWRDSAAVLYLLEDRGLVDQMREMAVVSRTPLDEICNGGQQRRVFNNLAFCVRGGAAASAELMGQDALPPLPLSGFAMNEGTSGWPREDRRTFGVDEETTTAADADADAPPLAGRKRSRFDVGPARRAADYVGATVFDPVSGFYGMDEPIASLDFASLYPSIICAWMLCYSTLINDRDYFRALTARSDCVVLDAARATRARRMEARARARFVVVRFVIDHGPAHGKRAYYFLVSMVGVLTRVIKHLLTARRAAKAAMKDATDPIVRGVQNHRQLALKVMTNSVYGFTGCSEDTGMYSCKPIAASVTTEGRLMIERTKAAIEARYAGARVIYGDTDSVMVLFGRMSVAECARIGAEAAAYVNAEVIDDEQDLEMEEIKAPAWFGATKKTYFAMVHEPRKDGGFDVHKVEKGVDSVRRDRIGLVRKTVSRAIDIILNAADDVNDQLRELLVEVLAGVLDGAHPLDDYVSSKTTRRTYVRPENEPQVQVRARLLARGEEAPPVGARVQYVFAEVPTPSGAPQAARARDPEEARAAGLTVDRAYYLNALRNPLRKYCAHHPAVRVDALVDAALALLQAKRTRRGQALRSADVLRAEHARAAAAAAANIASGAARGGGARRARGLAGIMG